MSKFNDIIRSYGGGSLLTEEEPPMAPPGVEAPPVEAPVDATTPAAPDMAPLTPEGRIQMLDMVRKALLISPTELKEHEKVELSTLTTHENVEMKKNVIETIFTRLQSTGTSDLDGEPAADEESY